MSSRVYGGQWYRRADFLVNRIPDVSGRWSGESDSASIGDASCKLTSLAFGEINRAMRKSRRNGAVQVLCRRNQIRGHGFACNPQRVHARRINS